MLIDCDSCAAPAGACSSCVMTVLLRGRAGTRDGRTRGPGRAAAATPGGVELDDAERDAIGALVHAGLVPPLRLVRAVTTPGPGGSGSGDPGGSWGSGAAQGIA